MTNYQTQGTDPGGPYDPYEAYGAGAPSGRQAPLGALGGRSDRRQAKQPTTQQIERARAREARWENNRFAVPYRTDGPKVMLGLVWFLLLVAAIVLGEYAESALVTAAGLALLLVPVAGIAGLQTGHAWFPNIPATRSWMAATAMITAMGGVFGAWGVVLGLLAGIVTLMFYLVLYRGHRRPATELFDVLARSGIPAGLAAGSLLAISFTTTGALVSLILLISAYEVGDYLIGTGAANAVEGPLAGFVGMGAVTFLLFLLQPSPFDATSMVAFALVAAVSAPLGQLFASALLPRGNAWAPALRRLDSYLLAAPLWLMLLSQVPGLE